MSEESESTTNINESEKHSGLESEKSDNNAKSYPSVSENELFQPSFFKRNKSIIILIAIVLGTIIITGIFLIAVYFEHSKQAEIINQEEIVKEQERVAEQEEIVKQKETAEDSYIANTETFQELCLEGSQNLDDLTRTLARYWYDAIFNDKHNGDITQAVKDWKKDKKDELTSAKEDKSTIDRFYYNHIQKLPDAVEDYNELNEIHDAAKDLYNAYSLIYFYDLGAHGTYDTLTEKRTNHIEEFWRKYSILDSLL